MMPRSSWLGALIAIALLVVPATHGTAGASAAPSKRCDSGASHEWCVLDVRDFPGGSLTVHYDSLSTNASPYAGSGRWGVELLPQHSAHCYGEFKPIDPPGSYTCSDVPAGHFRLKVEGARPLVIGVRF